MTDKINASRLLLSQRDTLHKLMMDIQSEMVIEDDKINIPKDKFYQSLYKSAESLLEAYSINNELKNEKEYKEILSIMKHIDNVVSNQCSVINNKLICNKDLLYMIGEFEKQSLNRMAYMFHEMAMTEISKHGKTYKTCIISNEMMKSKTIDAEMLSFCDGIMDWVKTKKIPVISEDEYPYEGISLPAQRLDIKMNGHGNIIKITTTPDGKKRFRFDYFDYDAKRFKALMQILSEIQNKPIEGFPTILSLAKTSHLTFTLEGEFKDPSEARTLSRFLMGTKDADFIGSDECRIKSLKESLNRAISYKDKPDITLKEQRSLISNIIACETKCDYVKAGKTLFKWYKEEGCI